MQLPTFIAAARSMIPTHHIQAVTAGALCDPPGCGCSGHGGGVRAGRSDLIAVVLAMAKGPIFTDPGSLAAAWLGPAPQAPDQPPARTRTPAPVPAHCCRSAPRANEGDRPKQVALDHERVEPRYPVIGGNPVQHQGVLHRRSGIVLHRPGLARARRCS